MDTDHQAETLVTRTMSAIRETILESLPGVEAYLSREMKAGAWVAEQEAKMASALRDNDRILTERAFNTWRKAIERVNEILAEEYRQAHPDATLWELRYLKWMTKVQYVRFESPLGEFFVLPRMPLKRPKAAHWYTVDEMIDMLHPSVSATILAFSALPVRPGAVPKVGPGEKVLHIDATGPQVEMHYEIQGVTNGRERVR